LKLLSALKEGYNSSVLSFQQTRAGKAARCSEYSVTSKFVLLRDHTNQALPSCKPDGESLTNPVFAAHFSESKENTVTFPEISTRILEKVVEYFHYKVRWSHSSEVPEFKIEPEIALELLMAANFLDT